MEKTRGFLRSNHKDCETKYLTGVNTIISEASNAAIRQNDLSTLRDKISNIAATSFIDDNSINGLIIKGWEDAVDKSLDDCILTSEEEDAFTAYKEYFNFEQEDLDTHGAYIKMSKGGILRRSWKVNYQID